MQACGDRLDGADAASGTKPLEDEMGSGKNAVTKSFDVTIAGEINLDLILYGLPETMPVERELLASGVRMTLGSSSAILAHNLAALGMRVGFVTRLGDDPLGEIALQRLMEPGVDVT